VIRSEARTLIRANTDHEGVADTQVTTTQLDTWIDIEHKLLCREIALIAPALFTTTDAEQTFDAADEDDVLTIPDDFERLVRVEKQAGTVWYPVPVSDELSPHAGSSLTVREEEDEFILSPLSVITGTYRIVYVRAPATLDSDADSLEVPGGCEDIICERVSARVRTKLDEDPSIHLANADRVWRSQKQALRRRYGKSPQPGIRLQRRW
jgi:hypothetical protein